MRDDFLQTTKDILFKRAQARCSNPACRRVTIMAHSEKDKAINIGVAAHITAAAPGGPRYDSALPAQERRSIHNAIWLCQNCAKLIDSDSPEYTGEILRGWKRIAEAGDEREAAKMVVFKKIEKAMPELLEEMCKHLAEHPLKREFILLKKSWSYTYGDKIPLVYYYDTHDDLDDKITLLLNHHLVRDITNNNTKRYRFTEELVDYLTQQ